MDEKLKLYTFPDGAVSGLAYLYVQAQDLSEKTPSEINTMYWNAYYEISKDFQQKRESGWFDTKGEA